MKLMVKLSTHLARGYVVLFTLLRIRHLTDAMVFSIASWIIFIICELVAVILFYGLSLLPLLLNPTSY